MTKTWSCFGFASAVFGKVVNASLSFALDTGKLLGLATLMTSVVLAGPGKAAAQSQPQPAPNAAQGANQDAQVSPLLLQQHEAWRKSMVWTQRPKKGCFIATYPETQWNEVPCVTPRPVPFGPKSGARPFTVGNGTDFSAQVTGNTTAAEGTFENVANPGGMTESGGGAPNKYSLQLNTNTFSTVTCAGALNPAACMGWEQFIYSSVTLGEILIQYWLLGYNNPCPAGWTSDGGGDCFINNAGALPVAVQAINAASLSQMTLSGDTTDQVTLASGGMMFTAPGDNHFPDLANGWRFSEFNIFGDSAGTPSADFNNGSTMDVRTRVNSGMGGTPPTCAATGFTGEVNNLTLVAAPAVINDVNWPSIVFTQNNTTATTASCDTADSIGDTHLRTFGSVYYDFQASGDFVLAENGPDFLVQARQASGAPTWPNAALNKGIATQMGKTRVAVYVQPDRLVIDGKTEDLADGKDLLLPTGVQVSRRGNLYAISSEDGNLVRARLNGVYIDTHVGLGHGAQYPRGLLGKYKRNVNQLVTSTGVVMTEPIAFNALYHTYGDSWRVQPNQSLFTEETTIRPGNPTKPFYSNDLPPKQAAHAMAVCRKAGVRNATLLDSCALDTTVLNDENAAKVFVNFPRPHHVIKPGVKGKDHDDDEEDRDDRDHDR